LNRFDNLDSYLESNGLRLSGKALFFLHLRKKAASSNLHENQSNISNKTNNKPLIQSTQEARVPLSPPKSSSKTRFSSFASSNLISPKSSLVSSTNKSNLSFSKSDNTNKIQDIIEIKPEPLELSNKISISSSIQKSTKRSRSPSSDSSYSSSSGESSFVKAAKLDKIYNRRLRKSLKTEMKLTENNSEQDILEDKPISQPKNDSTNSSSLTQNNASSSSINLNYSKRPHYTNVSISIIVILLLNLT
jgi:hypothetical protein